MQNILSSLFVGLFFKNKKLVGISKGKKRNIITITYSMGRGRAEQMGPFQFRSLGLKWKDGAESSSSSPSCIPGG